MADRSRLHIKKLEDFKQWLEKDGWVIEEPKGTWEVLRARKTGRKNPLIVYTKMDAKEHLSVMDRDSGVIGAYLRDSKKPKTRAEKIRCMSDEELADAIMALDTKEISEKIPFCKEEGPCSEILDAGELIPEEMCRKCLLEWLRTEEGEENNGK